MMWGGDGLEEGDDKLILNELVNGKAFKDHVCFFFGGGGKGGNSTDSRECKLQCGILKLSVAIH